MAQLFDVNSFNQIPWKDIRNGNYIHNYFEHLVKDGVHSYIDNVETELFFIKVDDMLLPITKNDDQYENSYVCSPFTHYVSYAREELWELGNKTLENFFEKIISMIGYFLKKSSFNKVVIVNNWLLSTNLYEQELTSAQIEKITACLIKSFPEHTIVFRSLNNKIHSSMLSGFLEHGYKKVMSRSIYLLDEEKKLTAKERKLLRQDASLFAKNGLTVTSTPEHLKEAAWIAYDLYHQLYIQKYSQHNPQFNRRFFCKALSNQLLHFKWIQKDEFVGVIGYLTAGNVLTTPILGYSVQLGKQFGLYRTLSYLITKEVMDQGYLGHRSAGASQFKRKRGAKQYIEYNVIYQNHLPFHAKRSWQFVKYLMDWVVEPMAKKRKF